MVGCLMIYMASIRFANNGASVVDYMIASTNLLPYFSGFGVIPSYVHHSDGNCRKLPVSVKICELTYLFNNLH